MSKSNNQKIIFIDKEAIKTRASKIQTFIDGLYPPFKRLLPIDSFRYLFCGGSNTVLDIFLYFIFYNFIIQKRFLSLGFISVSPHIFALIVVFPITFATGFLVSKYITFTDSKLKGRIQLFRFGVTIFSSLVLQYLFLKLFVDLLHVYPTPAKIITSGIVAISTYFSHKLFSFQNKA